MIALRRAGSAPDRRHHVGLAAHVVQDHERVGDPELVERLLQQIGASGRQLFEQVDQVVGQGAQEQVAPGVGAGGEPDGVGRVPEQVQGRGPAEALAFLDDA